MKSSALTAPQIEGQRIAGSPAPAAALPVAAERVVEGAPAAPASAVSAATGLVGLGGLAAAVVWLPRFELGLVAESLLCLLATALPMVIWAVAVEKVYRSPSTGLDFARARPALETLATTRVKLVGLYGIWGAIALLYFAARTYTDPKFDLYFTLLLTACVPLVVLAPVYVFLVDRHAREPRDGLWHTGQWLLGRTADRARVADQLRAWGVKAFFLAFMFSILPLVVAPVLQADLTGVLADPVAAAALLIKLMFLVDVCFGTVGYLLTLRPLDSHIRSANPYLAGWVAALACYPPFVVVAPGGPLDYTAGTQSWAAWLAGHELALLIWGALLVGLAGLYAWATMIFGLRFSNLTHRGIITNGPYRWFKHPAYLSKNLFWWLSFMPFLSTVSTSDALRSCLLLAAVNLLYYARAKTEERHLNADPAYRAYAAWIAEHGLLPRLGRALTGRRDRPAA